MASSRERKDRIIKSAEALFGEPVLRLDAPGGDGRSSYRLVFKERTVIATLRPNFRRTHVEAFTLEILSAYTDDVPKCLGVDGDIMFQSDLGGKRLNMEIVKASKATKADLAHEAVASIFRVQAAGRAARLEEELPHLGQNQSWMEGFVGGVEALADFSDGRSAGIDAPLLCERLLKPGRQFVKWDCRSGNAAVRAGTRVGWFDFEYSGARHGAEDLAWLIGDEAWPLPPEVMEDIVADAFDPGTGDALDAYLEYLALYLTFHCAQRFSLLVREVSKRGWRSKTRIRSRDDVGLHPEFAMHLCGVGAYFASRSALTKLVAQDFETAQSHFAAILRRGFEVA